MLAIMIVEGVALLLLGLLVVGLLRSHAEILRALHDLGADVDHNDHRNDDRGLAPIRHDALVGARGESVGAMGRDVQGMTLDGETVEIGVLGAARDTVLAFLSATCYTCEPFWRDLSGSERSVAADIPNDARLIVVVQAGDNVSKLRKLAGPQLLVVISDAAWSDYEVPGSPHFVYIDGPSGQVIGEGTASTWSQVRDLLGHALGAGAPMDVQPAGRDNAERIDLELLAAGIGPGHASLYPDVEASAADRNNATSHR
jgi:hypothetical protein